MNITLKIKHSAYLKAKNLVLISFLSFLLSANQNTHCTQLTLMKNHGIFHNNKLKVRELF